MLLYIIRHAIAEEREDFAKKNLEDSLRPLTIKGKKRMQKIVAKLKPELKELDLVVTSPFVRAKQTANLISEIVGKPKVIEVLNSCLTRHHKLLFDGLNQKVKTKKRF